MNDNRHGMPAIGSAYLEPVPSATSGPEDQDRGSDTEGDDESTVMGDPRSPSSISLVDDGDDEASTVAETGSVGTNDERWRALMRDLEAEEQPGYFSTADMEKVRSEAEQSETAARDQEYRRAIAEKEDLSVKSIRASDAKPIPVGVSTISLEGTTPKDETANLQRGANTELDNRRLPVSN